MSQWKAELQPKKTKVSGCNSFIANAPFQEFQVNLFWISKKKRKERTTKEQLEAVEKNVEGEPKDMVPALICVDISTKYVSAVLLPEERKTTLHITAALMQALCEMGCYDG